MNVASLELCKELYELSKWNETDCQYSSADGTFWSKAYATVAFAGATIPAYDLGYLLRKLPSKEVKLRNGHNHNDNKPYWAAQYTKRSNRLVMSLDNSRIAKKREYSMIADTPEDAACKLAIELFKQGIFNPTNIKERED